MKLRSLVFLGAVVLQLMLPAAHCTAQTKGSAGGGEGISLDFKDVDLPDLIQTISKFTGKNFIYDETVRGKVTLISPRAVSLEEAYQVFLAVLDVKGYTVITDGNVNTIVALKDAKATSVYPLTTEKKIGAGEQYVTRLFPLQYIDAGVVVASVLLPLVPKSSIVAYPQTNTLIISDRAGNVERVAEILEQLDVPDGNENIEVIELQYVAAEEMAKLVTKAMSQSTAPVVRRRGKAAAAGAPQDEEMIIPFRPTNVLVVRASDEELATIRSIVARLDQKPNQARSGIQVYYLENADAETLAKTMNEILTGIKTQTTNAASRTAAGAQPAKPAQVSQTLESVSITADKPTNSLIINSTPEEYETVRNIIRQLDIKRKQVYVEALILELSLDATKKLGTSLQGAVETSNDGAVFARTGLSTDNLTAASFDDLANPLASAINGILLGGIFNPITILGPDGTEITVPALSALIDLSKTDTDINILSAPRLLTSDNEEAEIIVGSNVPIITSRLTGAAGSTTDSTSLATSVAVDRKDVALTLRFTPQITEGELVRLNVYQEITNIADSNSNVGDPNQVGPSFTKRLIRNTVLAENGSTIVLGGLIDSNIQERITKVPLLGDIPLLGWLFKSKVSSEHKTNLLVFITPHIIKDGKDLAAVTSKAQQAMNQFQQEQGMSSENSNKRLEQRLEMVPESRENNPQ